ncbi:MAG: hypothetical protein LBQ94_10145 [Treponema sp.]|jgi:hypothetical protein|nr:hypothetical protein [Treponema sp.]
MKKPGRNLYFVLIAAMVLSILGCGSMPGRVDRMPVTTPVTDNIIAGVGVENLSRYQYFLSKPIVMKLWRDEIPSNRSRRGLRNNIVVPTDLPGRVIDYEERNNSITGMPTYFLTVRFMVYDKPLITEFACWRVSSYPKEPDPEKYYKNVHILGYINGPSHCVIEYDGVYYILDEESKPVELHYLLSTMPASAASNRSSEL